MSSKSQWYASFGVACISCVFGGIRAWPDMHKSDLFTSGAILFYLLVILVLSMMWALIRTIRETPQTAGSPLESPRRDAAAPADATTPSGYPPHFDEVRYAYRQLKLQEKIALALVQRNPRMDFNTAQDRVGDFYFSGKPIEALGPLMNTKPQLVDLSDRSEILIPDAIQDAVAEVLRREPPF